MKLIFREETNNLSISRTFTKQKNRKERGNDARGISRLCKVGYVNNAAQQN